jgi:hypothetical protein
MLRRRNVWSMSSARSMCSVGTTIIGSCVIGLATASDRLINPALYPSLLPLALAGGPGLGKRAERLGLICLSELPATRGKSGGTFGRA